MRGENMRQEVIGVQPQDTIPNVGSDGHLGFSLPTSCCDISGATLGDSDWGPGKA